jgi:ribosomal subunit interface protein
MQIEIQSQHSEVHPRWRAIIQRRAAKLADSCSGIIRLHVTLVHSTHHLRGDEEARLLVAVPNDTLRVQKAKASMGDAIHAAFVALERELRKWTDRRKRPSR